MTTVDTRNGEAELGCNAEPRRAGEVSLSVIGPNDNIPGFAWVDVADAREFAFAILRACRDSEDMAEQKNRPRKPDVSDIEEGSELDGPVCI